MQNIRLPTREAELLRLYKGDYSLYVFYYGDKTLNMLVCFTNTEFPFQFFNKDSHREVTKFSLKIEQLHIEQLHVTLEISFACL